MCMRLSQEWDRYKSQPVFTWITFSPQKDHLKSRVTSEDQETMTKVNTGYWGPTEDATPAIQEICDEVKPDVEKQTHTKYETYDAYKYRSQVRAGGNYIIKVHVGGVWYIHLMVYQSPFGHTQLGGVDQFHHKDDEIVPF